jgi:Fe-S-cluster containining protein
MPSDCVDPEDLFECQKCGDCCKGYGGTFVSATDIDAISGYIGEDPARFVDEYCSRSGAKLLLAQGKDGYCIFWNAICTIHPVKPRMCRTWPFIGSILKDLTNWWVIADSCPGIRTDVDPHLLEKYVRQMLSEMSPAGGRNSG